MVEVAYPFISGLKSNWPSGPRLGGERLVSFWVMVYAFSYLLRDLPTALARTGPISTLPTSLAPPEPPALEVALAALDLAFRLFGFASFFNSLVPNVGTFAWSGLY